MAGAVRGRRAEDLMNSILRGRLCLCDPVKTALGLLSADGREMREYATLRLLLPIPVATAGRFGWRPIVPVYEAGGRGVRRVADVQGCKVRTADR
jgi:hypothetical protein